MLGGVADLHHYVPPRTSKLQQELQNFASFITLMAVCMALVVFLIGCIVARLEKGDFLRTIILLYIRDFSFSKSWLKTREVLQIRKHPGPLRRRLPRGNRCERAPRTASHSHVPAENHRESNGAEEDAHQEAGIDRRIGCSHGDLCRQVGHFDNEPGKKD